MLVVLLGFAAVSLFIWWILGLHHPSLSEIPRVHGWPILGNALQVNFDRPDLTFTEWSKKLGGVFAVKLFNESFVVLNSYDAIFEVLVRKGEEFAGRPKSFRLNYFSEGFKGLFFTDPNPKWKLMRKVCHKQIKMYDVGMEHLEKMNLSVIDTLVNTFRQHQDQPFNPRPFIYHTVVNLMTSLLVNRRYGINDKIFKDIVNIERLGATSIGAGGRGVELDLLPWLRYFGNSTFKKLKWQQTLSHDLWRVMEKSVLEDLTKSQDNKARGLTHAFIQLYQEQQNGQTPNELALQEGNLRQAFIDTVAAGTTTTTNSFYAFLNILCNNPSLQQNLREEVDRVVGPQRTASLNDKKDMPYTQATVLELLRFTSVATLGVPHAALVDTSVCGMSVPKGVQVWTNLWALHHDEDFWDEPFEFKPERFLENDGTLVSASHENRKHLMPFGAGTRVCIGETLALARLFLLIASMVQVFEIESGTKRESCNPRGYHGGIVLSPNDYDIKVKCRNDFLFTNPSQ